MRSLKAGSTSVILDDLFIGDSSSTTGAGLTGLAYNTAGLTCYYHRNTGNASAAVTLASMTLGTFTSGGFLEVDATNMPGIYSFCPPNAAIASGAQSVTFFFKGATNMVPTAMTVELLAVDPQDGVAGGMTALPNAAAAASGGLIINGSNSGTVTLAALTCTGTFTISDGLAISRSSSNTSAITATGNGTGHGAVFTSGSGATGNGVNCTSAATNGSGLSAAGNGTGHGINAQSGSGASADGIHAASNAASGSGNGVFAQGASAGDGLAATGGPTGRGIHAVGGSTSGAGIRCEGNVSATAAYGFHAVGIGANDGCRLDAGSGNALNVNGPAALASTLTVTGATTFTGAVTATNASNDIRGVKLAATGLASVTAWTVNITGNITGNLSGSVGSVSNAASIATAVWTDLTASSDFTTVGSIGALLVDGITTGGVIVGGYATGQDPATLVLDVLSSSHATVGTVGGQIAKIGVGQVSTSSPVAQSGNLRIIQGTDYYAVDGTLGTITWQEQSANWPDLTYATAITVTVFGKNGTVSMPGRFVTRGGTSQVVGVEIPRAVSATLSNGPFGVVATLQDGHEVELVAGSCIASQT